MQPIKRPQSKHLRRIDRGPVARHAASNPHHPPSRGDALILRRIPLMPCPLWTNPRPAPNLSLLPTRARPIYPRRALRLYFRPPPV